MPLSPWTYTQSWREICQRDSRRSLPSPPSLSQRRVGCTQGMSVVCKPIEKVRLMPLQGHKRLEYSTSSLLSEGVRFRLKLRLSVCLLVVCCGADFLTGSLSSLNALAYGRLVDVAPVRVRFPTQHFPPRSFFALSNRQSVWVRCKVLLLQVLLLIYSWYFPAGLGVVPILYPFFFFCGSVHLCDSRNPYARAYATAAHVHWSRSHISRAYLSPLRLTPLACTYTCTPNKFVARTARL